MTSIVLLGLPGCQEEALPDKPAAAEKPVCRRTKSYHYTGDITSTTTFEYDVEDRLIHQNGTSISGTGESGYTKSFEYNLKGQVIKHTNKSYFKEGTRQSASAWDIFFAYNEKGQVVKLEDVMMNIQDGKETRRIYTQEYDSEGNRTRVNRLYGDSAAVVSLFEYRNGDCIKATLYIGTQYERVTEYEYYLDRVNKLQAEQTSVWGYSHSAPKHMLRKETSTPKADPQLAYYLNYSYEYNDKGFAVKGAITPSGAQDNATTFLDEYICQ